MAAGLPIIAVDEGGYVEACSPEYAFLIPPYPLSFAEKIRYLQQNPEIAHAMGKAARIASQSFTWKRAAELLEAILKDTWKKFPHLKTSSSVSTQGTLVGVQYYLWYNEGFGEAHWNDNPESGYVSDKPLLGYYGSTKGRTIEYHLDLFEEMGLDYVILNLHVDNNVNAIELMGIQHVFDIAKKRGSSLRFAIQIAPYAENISKLKEAIEMLTKLYASHPNYLYLENKPALFWFWSSAYDRKESFIAFLKSLTQSYVNIAVSLRLPDEKDEGSLSFNFFEGFCPFSPLELSKPENWAYVWNSAYQAAEKAGMHFRIATLSPGYDDSGLTSASRIGNSYRIVPREEGETYKRGMSFIESLKNPPNLVMISTFNEYHEGTHIEPSQHYGRQYVDLTKSFVKKLKQKQGLEA